MTRFGYNAGRVDGLLRPHLEKINPGGMVYFQNDLNEARWAKAAFPKSNIVVRYWPDADTHIKYQNVEAWVNAHSDLIGSGLILQTTNEPAFTDALVQWHERLLTYLLNTGIDLRVGVLGLSVGVPRPEEWVKANNLFRLMEKMGDRAYLILHEYFAGVISSGIIGGYPNNAGVAPGQPGGKNLIPEANWPPNPTAGTLWHVGRYWFLKRHLAALGIRMPKVIIGEFGADYLSDIDGFLKSLKSSAGQYDSVDGWRDLHDTWRQWYNNRDPGETYMRMAAYADQHIYGEDVVAIIFYHYGDMAGWAQYRVDPDLIPYMETYARVVQPPLVVVPPPVVITPTPPAVKDRSPELKALIQQTLDRFV